MTEKLFGTDGVRGRVGERWITPEYCLRLGRAAAVFFSSGKKNSGKVFVGYDTRQSGSMLAASVAAGFAAEGFDVSIIGVVPTPAVSVVTMLSKGVCGVVISASHNPYWDNGIKFFKGDGTKLSDEEEMSIEEIFHRNDFLQRNEDVGSVQLENRSSEYISFLNDAFENLDLHGMKIALDCANGAAFSIAPKLLKDFGAEVIAFGISPDGININEDVGATHPAFIAGKVVEEGCDLGITLDGDADRLIMVDGHGNVVDGDQLIGMAARFFKKNGVLSNDMVITTIMSNIGLEIFLKGLGITLERAGVGDRYVASSMREKGSVLGGENSGHMIFSKIGPTGDGLVSALSILSIIRNENKPLDELVREIPMYPQVSKKVVVQKKPAFEYLKKTGEAIAEAEKRLENGRIVVRYSGTEPVLRIMAEGENREELEKVVSNIAEVADLEIKSL